MKEGWEYKKLGEIATEMYRGSGIKRDQVTKEGTPCVRYGEIYTTYNISFDTCASHTKIENVTSPKYFEYGDLLFAITGESVEDIGKTIAYLGDEKCLCGGDIICMKHHQNPKYLAYALSTPDAIRQKGIGKTKLKVVHTNAPALKAISIPLAPLSEQQSIVDYLDSAFAKIDAMKANAEKRLNEAQALFQASLKKMLEPKEGWEEKRIDEVCSIARGGSPRPIKDFITNSPEGLNWIKIGDTDMGGKYIYSTKEKIKPEGLKKSRWVEVDEFLLSNSMSFGRPYILKTNGCIHDGWLTIQDYQDTFDTDFLYYMLSSEVVFNQYVSMAAGSSVQNLNKEKVAAVKLFYPPSKTEQSAIANVFSDMDTEIATLETKLAKYRKLKTGMMQQLLTGKIRLV